MNNNDETTVFQDKSTEQNRETKGGWKGVAVGTGVGLLIGGVTAVAMEMNNGEKSDNHKNDLSESKQDGLSDNDKEVLSHPEWVDGEVQVATDVSDNMSFGEAFAAARAEVGPGGCFEWHGMVYGTYTADEWNGMTAGERAEYGSHFNWNNLDHSTSHVAQHSTAAHVNNEIHAVEYEDDIEVVSVDHHHGAGNETEVSSDNFYNVSDDNITAGDEAEVEILGVIHDSESGANIGGMTVGDQEVIFVDVDGDLEFDYMISDINNNGQIEQDEQVNIQGEGISVYDLGGFINNDEAAIADDSISSDALYEM